MHNLALAPAPHKVLSPTVRLLIHQPTANVGPLSCVQTPPIPISVFQHSYLEVVHNALSYAIPQAWVGSHFFKHKFLHMLTLQKVQHASLLLSQIIFKQRNFLLSFFTPPSSPKNSCLSPLYYFHYMLAILFVVEMHIDYQAKIAVKLQLIFLLWNFTIFLFLVKLIVTHF